MSVSRHVHAFRFLALVMALLLALSSVVAVSATHQQGQVEQQQEQQNQNQRTQDQLQQLEEERQQLEEEIQQLEEENAPQRQIRQREQELQQVEQEIQRLEQQQQDQQGQDRNQQNQEQLEQLEQEQQQLREERQQLQEEIQQLEEEDAPQRQIRQRERELRQVERELRQVERELQLLGPGQQPLEVQPGEDVTGLPDRAQQVSLREVIRNTDEFVGQRVQVSGDLEETPVPHVFELVARNQQIALIADPQNVPDNVQGEVVVVGTVQQISPDQLIQALDIQVPRSVRNLLRDFGPIGVIFAERVMTGEQGQGAPEEQQENIFQALLEAVGERVNVTAPVGQELEREAFTITTRTGQEVLVVGDRQAIPSNLGNRVEVTGEVRESFNVGDVENELGVRLNDQQLQQFEDQPFILAEDVMNAQQGQ